MTGKFTTNEPTVYAVLYQDSHGSTASASQIKNGLNPDNLPALWAGSVSASPTGGTFDWPSIVSGVTFTPGQNYRIAMVWSDGTNDSNVSESTPFALSLVDFELGFISLQTTGAALSLAKQFSLNLEPKSVRVTGFNLSSADDPVFNLEPRQTLVTGSTLVSLLERLIDASARQIVISGFAANLAITRYLNLESVIVRTTGTPMLFLGSYVYPDPEFVRAGVHYGPTGIEFKGSFVFLPAIDLFTGNVVTQESYSVFPLTSDTPRTTLTEDLVAEGVVFGSNNQVGVSRGFLSYDNNTGRIVRPVSKNALMVV